MAQLQVTAFRDVTIVLDYNANNGKVSSFTCINASGSQIWGKAWLSDGRTFEATFQDGTTPVNLPANVLTISFDVDGEATIDGLSSFSAAGPTP